MSGHLGNPRVLVVDDEPSAADALAEVLREPYELLVAPSGPRALELAAEGHIDLILLDVGMPGMDGFEVCRRLKADDKTRQIPVVFLAASGEVDDATRGLDAGGVDYVAKPISPALLRSRIRTHLELTQARERLEELTSVDALTGIANRRRFDACLEHEWRRALRSERWLSVALLDIDYFERFNGRYGRPRGDDCLRQVGQSLAESCRRPADLAARYSGEEFALVLPDTDPVGAEALAAGVLARVEELAIEHLDSPCAPRISVSLGAVSLVPSGAEDPKGVLDRADRMLYEAKADGRHQGIHLNLATGAKRTIALTPPQL